MDSVAEGVVEPFKPAGAVENGVGIHFLDGGVGGVQGSFTPHVLEYKTGVGTGHFTAFHGVTSGNIIGRGQVTYCAAFKPHGGGLGGVDFPAGRFHGEGGDFLDRAAEVLHDVDGMGVQCLQVIVHGFQGHKFADPQGHVAEQEGAEPSVVLPFFGLSCGGGKPVVHIDPVAQALLFSGFHHFDGVLQVIGDGLFPQHVTSGFQRFHGGLVVVGGIFVSPGGHACHIRLHGGQHFLCRCKVRYPELLSGFLCQFRHPVTHCNQFRFI